MTDVQESDIAGSRPALEARAMLSTIIVPPPGRRGAPASCAPLVRTLASLVPATVAGTVRDVTVLLIGRNEDVASVADEAGCRLVESEDFGDAMRLCLASARAPWVLVLRAGAAPSRDFGDDVADALDWTDATSRALVLRQDRSGWRRFMPMFAPIAGVIAPRHTLQDHPLKDFADIVRRARPARTLATRVALMADGLPQRSSNR